MNSFTGEGFRCMPDNNISLLVNLYLGIDIFNLGCNNIGSTGIKLIIKAHLPMLENISLCNAFDIYLVTCKIGK